MNSNTASQSLSWWETAVIYQIYPRSYQDSNNDGIGDLPGITSRLEYIANLGVDAIWISPFFKSPQKDFGYDVSDYCDINPEYGTLADFDELRNKAHNLGLKIMVDIVPAHCSDQHQWFEESRQSRDNKKADWFHWVEPKPDGSPPNNWLSFFGETALDSMPCTQLTPIVLLTKTIKLTPILHQASFLKSNSRFLDNFMIARN